MKTLRYRCLVSIFFLTQLSLLTPSLHGFSQEPPKTSQSTELAEAEPLIENARKLFKEGKHKDALPLAKRALEIRERLLPANDPRIEASLFYVGDIQMALGEYRDARETFQQLLQKQERRLGTGAGNLAPTLDRLCVVNFSDRSYGKAEDACKRSLAIKEVSLGPKHPDVAHSLFMLAEQYRLRGDSERAAPFYSRALLIYGELPKEYSPKYQQVREGFVCLCHETKKHAFFKELETIDKKFAPPITDPTVQTENRILNGKAISLPRPEYSSAARSRGEQGMVLVKVMIDETGKVISAVDMCQGPPALSYESVKAAKLARFSPTKLSGMPVKVQGYITYNFQVR